MKKMTRKAAALIAGKAGDVINSLSDLTGIRYVTEPLPHPDRPRCRTLMIPGYRQVQNFTCGFVAAANILHLFSPEAELEPLYGMLDDSDGTAEWQIVSALRRHDVNVRRRTTLGFPDICRAVDNGRPVICAVSAWLSGHWVVIYGYDKVHRTLFVCGNGILPVMNRKEIPYDEFCVKRDPAGNGLVCSARKIIQPESKGRRSGRPINLKTGMGTQNRVPLV